MSVSEVLKVFQLKLCLCSIKSSNTASGFRGFQVGLGFKAPLSVDSDLLLKRV